MVSTLLMALGCRASRPLPDWGDAAFTVAGSDSLSVRAGGVDCDGSTATVRPLDVEGYWALAVTASPPSVWWSRREHRADAIQPGPTWTARAPAGLSYGDERVVLSGVELTDARSNEVVRIDGVVRCPVAADPVVAAAVDALEAAGGAVSRVGVRAMAEVPTDRVGAAVDATRGRVGPGVVVYAGGAGEVWVAPGSGPGDIVRHARVAGPDAPWVAAQVARLVLEHRIDLIAADATSLTARLPQGVDARRLAREVAALCPAILDAPDASVEALEVQLERDGQLVCWWP